MRIFKKTGGDPKAVAEGKKKKGKNIVAPDVSGVVEASAEAIAEAEREREREYEEEQARRSSCCGCCW